MKKADAPPTHPTDIPKKAKSREWLILKILMSSLSIMIAGLTLIGGKPLVIMIFGAFGVMGCWMLYLRLRDTFFTQE